MRIIDTHCHAAPVWYEPVEALIFHMDRNEVEQTVLIQINGYYDNEYQFECERRYPGRFVSVVKVDSGQPDAADQLEKLAEAGARGVRLAPDERSPGSDPLAIWRKAAELGLPVSCCGSRSAFASGDFAQLVEALPELPIIIEHLGGIKAADDGSTHGERDRIFDLARYPNAYMKIHGLGEFCTRNTPVTPDFPFDRAGLPLLQRAYDTFGPDRLMWGSDYPPVAGREGYRNALRMTMDQLSNRPEDELAQVFGGVAAKVFGL